MRQTYILSYKNKGTNRQKMIITPTDSIAEYFVTTDFNEIGIISTREGNYGMMEAIEATAILTNCIVNRIERQNKE